MRWGHVIVRPSLISFTSFLSVIIHSVISFQSAIEDPSNIGSQSLPKEVYPASHEVEPSRLPRKEEIEGKPRSDSSGADQQSEERSSDVQPTPPPRKKKLEKLLRKQIEANERNTKKEDSTPSQETGEDDAEAECTDERERDSTTSKKTRRKNKHSK